MKDLIAYVLLIIGLNINSFAIVQTNHKIKNGQNIINSGSMQSSKITIHFLYGSKPKRLYKNVEKNVFGGILGGHVYIQIADYLYGFQPIDEKCVHVFPHKKYNGYFKKENYSEWIKFINSKKLTSIEIPLDSNSFLSISDLLEYYLINTPYDYAFLGMRCAASSYDILSKFAIFEEKPKWKTIISIFYPRLLRRKLIKKAINENYLINRQIGSDKRIWESE